MLCMFSQTRLNRSTLPCLWLNISAECVCSLSFKEKIILNFQSDKVISSMLIPLKLFWTFAVCSLHKRKRHLCLLLKTNKYFLKKESTFILNIFVLPILFVFNSTIYDWWLKVWLYHFLSFDSISLGHNGRLVSWSAENEFY